MLKRFTVSLILSTFLVVSATLPVGVSATQTSNKTRDTKSPRFKAKDGTEGVPIFDKNQRVIAVEVFPVGKPKTTVKVEYDEQQHLSTLREEGGDTMRFEYNPKGLLSHVTGSSGVRFKIERNQRGKIVGITPEVRSARLTSLNLREDEGTVKYIKVGSCAGSVAIAAACATLASVCCSGFCDCGQAVQAYEAAVRQAAYDCGDRDLPEAPPQA